MISPRSRKRRPFAGAALLLFFLPASTSAEPVSIEATDDQFFRPRYEPWNVTASPGTPIQVTNTGSDRHTFTSVAGSWTELNLAAGRSGTVKAPTQTGDYRFYCRFHASRDAPPGEGMAGILRVSTNGTVADDSTFPKRQPAPDLALTSAVAALVAIALATFRSRKRT